MRSFNIDFSLKKITYCIIGIIVFILLYSSFFTVNSGTRKIVLTAGEATSVATEGLNFKIPLLQTTKTVNIKTLQVTQEARAASKDLQIVSSTISVNYHFDSSKLLQIYKTTGFEVNDSIVSPRIQETLKAVASQYSAEGLITQREKAKIAIDNVLKKDLAKYGIIIEAIQLTEFNFSDGFNESIELKQTEQQNTLKAENILQRTKIEADQRIAQAEGEAEAIRIQSNAITNNGGAEYISLKAIEKWDGKLPQVSSGDSSGMILNLNDIK